MAFADRAIAACDRAMESGELSERNVRDVLRSGNANVQVLARHIQSKDPMIRRAVARIIGKKGDVTQIMDDALREEDPEVLRALLSAIGKRGQGTQLLERMINCEDSLVREEAISMLRRAGKAGSLLPLLFDMDDALVNRVKRYINDQKERTGTTDSIS
jgi:HEAT repeat protein